MAMTLEYDSMEMMELSEETLEGVVGGMTSLQRIYTERFARDARREGLTLDEAIDTALHPTTGKSYFDDEMIQYMTEYWDSILME